MNNKNANLFVCLTAALMLAGLSRPAFADPEQGADGPGTPGTGEAGPGEAGPPSDGPGTDGAGENRDWVNYWLDCVAHTDRPEWAQGEAEACSEPD
jgi:hypothetical protein